MVRVRKCLVVLLALVFVSSLAWVAYLDSAYFLRLPEAPQKADGRIYPIGVHHGYLRYGTQDEVRRLGAAERSVLLGFLCAAAAGAINARYRDFRAPFS